MAVWPDGTQTVLHYEIAVQESEAAWLLFFEHLRQRGLQHAKHDRLKNRGE